MKALLKNNIAILVSPTHKNIVSSVYTHLLSHYFTKDLLNFRLNNVTPSHLQKTRAHRYEKAVPPEEDTGRIKKPESIDKYAFGVLAEEVLASKSEGMIIGDNIIFIITFLVFSEILYVNKICKVKNTK